MLRDRQVDKQRDGLTKDDAIEKPAAAAPDQLVDGRLLYRILSTKSRFGGPTRWTVVIWPSMSNLSRPAALSLP